MPVHLSILGAMTTQAREAGFGDGNSVRYSVLNNLPAGEPMPKLKPSRDIQPVTEFRARAAQFIEQVQKTREPVFLTQHGRSAAVLLDVESYETLLDEIALLNGILEGEEQLRAGKFVSHASVMKKLQARIAR
jgi:prevent-host-death family protein